MGTHRALARVIARMGRAGLSANLMACALGLVGCVSIDSRIDEVVVVPLPRDGTVSKFANQSAYASTEKFPFEVVTDFADALGLPRYRDRPRADHFALQFVDPDSLRVTLTMGSVVLYEATYRTGEDLEMKDNGQLALRRRHDFAGSELGGIYGTGQVTLFLNQDDDLVVVQTADFVGLVVVVPLMAHARTMSIFPRAE